ncbi:MAG: PAS domain-containing protein [Pseudomonadota bacterium]
MDLNLEFPGNSDVGALLRTRDWSTSVLGAPEVWPLSLRSVVRLILNSKFPMFVAWGPELGFLYNDAYAEILGSKHPHSLGARFEDIWIEIWANISPIIDSALMGQSNYFEDLPLLVDRNGHLENAWFTFSYSPVHDDQGTIAGMYCSVVETTKIVRDKKLRTFQLNLADQLHRLTLPDEIISNAVEMLAEHLDATGCWYAEINDQAGIFHTKSGWFVPGTPPLPPSGKIDDFGPSLLPALRSGREFMVNNLATDWRTSDAAHLYRALNIGSILIVPVIRDGGLAFNINITKPCAYVWTKEDVQAAREVLDRTWAALENAVTQQRLKLERGQSDHILNQMDEGFMLVGPSWRVTKINAEGLRILGRSEKDVLGKTHWDLWSHDIAGKVVTAYNEVLGTGATTITELNYQSASSEIWLELRISLLKDKGLTVFFRNVTAQKCVALALRTSEEHLSSLFEQTATGIAERDLQGRLIRVNEHLCKILGRSREEVLGVNIHDLTHPDDLARSEIAFKKLLSDGQPFDIEKRYIRPDGTSVWVSTMVSFIQKTSSQPKDSVLAIIADITERKRAEAALKNTKGAWLSDVENVEAILECSSDAIVILDRAWHYIFVNEAAESLFRSQRNQLLGSQHWQRYPELIGTPAESKLLAAVKTSRPVNFEQFIPTLYSWHSVLAVPLGNKLVLYCRDITDRMRLMQESAVREGTRKILENVPLSLTITRGADHRIDMQNKRSREMMSGRNLEGMLLRRALPEIVEQGLITLLDEVYQSGLAFSGADMPLTYNRDNSGVPHTGFFDLTYQPFFDTNGKVDGILHIGADVTERLAEKNLLSRLAAERDATLRQLSEGVILTDATGRITFINDKAREMHGVAVLDVTVDDYSESYRLFTIDGSPYPSLHLPLARAVLNDEFVLDSRWKIQRPDGTMITVEGNAQPIFDDKHKKIACVLVIRHCQT